MYSSSVSFSSLLILWSCENIHFINDLSCSQISYGFFLHRCDWCNFNCSCDPDDIKTILCLLHGRVRENGVIIGNISKLLCVVYMHMYFQNPFFSSLTVVKVALSLVLRYFVVELKNLNHLFIQQFL